MKKTILLLITILVYISCEQKKETTNQINTNEMIIRLSEIEIYPEFLEEYLKILKEESSASVRLEPGVISIYPIYQKDKETEIRILEIYASKEAYDAHIASPHFQEYKTTTLKMVKSLKLIDMEAIDSETMDLIFEKLKN